MAPQTCVCVTVKIWWLSSELGYCMAYSAQFKGFIFTANVHSLASVRKADFPGGYGVLSWEEAIEIMVALRFLRSPHHETVNKNWIPH